MNKLVGIKSGDVVRIKFKSIYDITKSMKMTQTLGWLSDYDIGCNVNALVSSGDFVVIGAENINDPDPFIEIDNHLDGGSFSVHNNLIDTIEVIEVTNKFASEDHGIVIIQVDNKLYINGELLSNEKEEVNSTEPSDLERFTIFMEKFLVTRAFEDCLTDDIKPT